MCDCYEHKCEHKTCTQTIPMHIGGFDFPRTDFKVWCSTHIKEAESGSVIFKWREWNKNYKCAIKGPQVGLINNGDNAPNTASECKESLVE